MNNETLSIWAIRLKDSGFPQILKEGTKAFLHRKGNKFPVVAFTVTRLHHALEVSGEEWDLTILPSVELLMEEIAKISPYPVSTKVLPNGCHMVNCGNFEMSSKELPDALAKLWVDLKEL